MFVVQESPRSGSADDDDCRRCCREEFTCSSFGLGHPHPKLFTVSQWRGPGVLFVGYRIVLTLYCLVWLALSGTGIRNDPTWPIFLTNWSYLLLNLRLIIQTVIAFVYYYHYDLKRNEGPHNMNFLLRFQWFLFNTSSVSALITSLNFWVFLYFPFRDTYELDLVSINTHGTNSVIVLLDLFIVAIPLRLFHFYQPFFFVLIYFIFNAIYILAGGLNDLGEPFVYAAFDWNTNPQTSTINAALVLTLVLAAWLVFYALFWIRRALTCCFPGCDVTKRSRGQVSPQEVIVMANPKMVQPMVLGNTYM